MSSQIFIQFREQMEVRWSQVWDIRLVVQDSETKPVILRSSSCARVRTHIVVLEENPKTRKSQIPLLLILLLLL